MITDSSAHLTALLALLLLSMSACTFDSSALEERKCKSTNACVRHYGVGFQCLEGYCVKESPCATNDDCVGRLGEGFVCVQEVCRESSEPACLSDADCDDEGEAGCEWRPAEPRRSRHR